MFNPDYKYYLLCPEKHNIYLGEENYEGEGWRYNFPAATWIEELWHIIAECAND